MGLFSDPQLLARLANIERKLDAIMSSLGIELPPDNMDEYRELVRANKKLDAIKLYRERTRAGLAEAKTAIDQLS